MEYQENVLCYEDYCRLRESVGWTNFSKEQTQAALSNSLYTVAVFENSQAVGMGRLIGLFIKGKGLEAKLSVCL